MRAIKFTLLVCLLAVLTTIIAAFLGPTTNSSQSSATRRMPWELPDNPASGENSGQQSRPVDWSSNCFP